MKKYKVTITRTADFIVDVLAENEQEASNKATERFAVIKLEGTEHYHSEGDSVEEVGAIYDVTDTDDEFNP